MNHTLVAGSAIASFLLIGCAEQEETEVPEIDAVAVVPTDDAYPVGGTLNEGQQANYDAFDREAATRDYEAGWTAMQQSGPADTAMAGATGSAGDMTGNEAMASGATPSAGSTTSVPSLRPRSQMDFAFLDRNSDRQLSVGEYAIWAVPANPAKPAPNDQTRPFISTEQLNEAGQTFFYFDENGDTYLSESEFTKARNSAITP